MSRLAIDVYVAREPAAAAFYDRHSPTVMAIALRMVRERADADGIVLETSMQAWRDAARFDAALPGSPALVAEVAAYRDVTTRIAQQSSMQPSPAVRDGFLDRIAASKNAQLPPTTVTAARAPQWMTLA